MIIEYVRGIMQHDKVGENLLFYGGDIKLLSVGVSLLLSWEIKKKLIIYIIVHK